jgi:uncharacterized protein (TIGR03437 family)
LARRFALLVCALLAPLAALCQQSNPSPEDLSARVKALNAELILSIAAKTEPARLAEILETRAALLSALMIAGRPEVLELALPEEMAQDVRALAPPDTVETVGEWTGTLTMIVGDDFLHRSSSIHWVLHTPEGVYDVFSPSLSTRYSGRSVRISGVSLGMRVFARTFSELAISGAVQGCTTTGTQNVVVIMLTTPSNPTFPAAFTKASLQAAFFGTPTDTKNTQSLNGFWKEMSYGTASAAGQVLGPFALSKDYTFDAQSQMLAEAVNLADPTVDFSQFTHVALVFPLPSIENWAGNSGDSTIGCSTISSPSKGNLPSSISWLPALPPQPNGAYTSIPIPLYAHELGHGLGLNHSSSDDYGSIPLGPLATPGTTSEYGDPFSVMGSGFGQYVAQHKSLLLHWLNPGDYQEVSSSGTYTLAPYETTQGLRALRVLRGASPSSWLWIEYRQPVGDIDSNLQSLSTNVFGGALIHYEDPHLDSPGHSYLLDFNPKLAPNDFTAAALTPGNFWSDPYSPLSLSVGAATPQGLSITVSYVPLTKQTITFGTLSSVTVGVPPFALSATASSGLAVTFASTTVSVCTVSGAMVTILAAGTCSITATQFGNTNFAPANPVTQSFNVNSLTKQTITFGALSDVTVGAPPFALSAAASSGLAVTFTSTTVSVCTVSGTVVTIIAAGTCSITASQGGSANFAPANPVTQVFVVNPVGAIVLYSNLGTGGNVYSSNVFALINSATGGYSGAGLIEFAYPFTPRATAGFTRLDVGVGLVTGAGSLIVNLMSDANGPGNILQSWTLTNTLPTSNACCTLQRLSGDGTISLIAGTTYWVAVLPGANTWAWWDQNVIGVNGQYARNQGSGWSLGSGVTGAFDVQGVVVSQPGAPSINSGGIVPVDSTVPIIQPGEWVSIFGANLAASTVTWNGDFPNSLGGTSVTINGRPAYLAFVSGGQVNLQAPNDPASGAVPVVVKTAAGSATSTVTLAQFAPSFFLLDGRHVAGIVLRSDGSGAYGGGAYDIIGPTGTSLGYATVAAKEGDTIELFGTGFGPTSPVAPPGQPFVGAAPAINPVTISINNVNVTPSFAGLSGAGLYQINLTVPSNLGLGDMPLQAIVGGSRTPAGVVISLR